MIEVDDWRLLGALKLVGAEVRFVPVSGPKIGKWYAHVKDVVAARALLDTLDAGDSVWSTVGYDPETHCPNLTPMWSK